MPAGSRGRTAPWAKVLAAIVLLVLLPLVLWFMVSLSRAPGIPW